MPRKAVEIKGHIKSIGKVWHNSKHNRYECTVYVDGENGKSLKRNISRKKKKDLDEYLTQLKLREVQQPNAQIGSTTWIDDKQLRQLESNHTIRIPSFRSYT